jgi:exonuclease III
MGDYKIERWDTREVCFNYGKDFGDKNTGRSEGVCFMLNKTMAAAFERGGRRTKKHCPRLATIRVPISRHEKLYIVNARAPDSGQSRARREGFQRRLESALDDYKEDETLVLAGDFNAATGVAVDEQDGVVGPHGVAKENAAGRELARTAAIYGLVDLVSWEPQKFHEPGCMGGVSFGTSWTKCSCERGTNIKFISAKTLLCWSTRITTQQG